MELENENAALQNQIKTLTDYEVLYWCEYDPNTELMNFNYVNTKYFELDNPRVFAKQAIKYLLFMTNETSLHGYGSVYDANNVKQKNAITNPYNTGRWLATLQAGWRHVPPAYGWSTMLAVKVKQYT